MRPLPAFAQVSSEHVENALTGVTVSPEVRAGLVPDATVTLQVRSPVLDPADPALVRAVVDTFADGLRGRDPGLVDASGDWLGPKYVGPVVPLPDGPALTIDVGQMPDSLRDGLPERLVGLLADAGVSAGEIVLPANDMARYVGLRSLRSAARALVRGPAGGGWQLAMAEGWLGSGPVRGLVLSTPVEVPAGAVAVTLAPMLAAETTVTLVADATRTGSGGSDTHAAGAVPGAAGGVASSGGGVAGDVGDAVGTASMGGAASTGGMPGTGVDPIGGSVGSAVAVEGFGRGQLALMHAGPGWAAGMRRQRDLVRRFAGRVDWAGVTAEADAERLLTTGWWDPTRPSAEWLADVLVPDAMWFQVLSPGHVDRLGGPPEGAEDLGEGRYGLTVDEPERWLPSHPESAAVRARGRALLAGCLSSPAAVAELNRARR